MSLYWIKKVKGKKQRVWNYGRSRGLELTKESIGDVLSDAKKLLKNKAKIRVLEVGCGYGKALLELKNELKDRIETYGINKEKRWKLKLVRQFGLAEKIFTKQTIDKNLPKIYILNAGKKLPFPSNYFDLIYSQHCMQYIGDKAKFLEEVNRLLKKDGIAKIHAQAKKSSMPVEHRHLFEIWDKKGKRIDFADYIKKFHHIKARETKKNENYILMKKAKNFKLNLKLITSFDLNKINPDWWGSEAIYVVK